MAFSFHRSLSNHSFRNHLQLFLAILVGFMLLTTGCHRTITDPKDPNFIVAEKGKWQITRADLNTEIDHYLKQHQATVEQVGPAKMPVLESAMLDNMVLEKLLLERAATLNLKDVDKEEAAAFDQVKGKFPNEKDFEEKLKATGMTVDSLKKRLHEQVLLRKVVQAEAFQNTEPSDQDINDIYLKNKDRFVTPPEVRASRILVLLDEKTSPADKAAKKKVIDQARDRVVKGEDFSKVAAAVSEDRYSSPRGGDIGFFQKGVNEPGFDDVAFKSKVGVVTPVFETSLGYQFLKVTDTRPGGPIPVADARSYISNQLRQGKQQEQLEIYTKKILAQGGVTYHLKHIDLTQPNAAAAAGNAPAGAAPAPGATSPH